jgi:hypothetical protein
MPQIRALFTFNGVLHAVRDTSLVRIDSAGGLLVNATNETTVVQHSLRGFVTDAGGGGAILLQNGSSTIGASVLQLTKEVTDTTTANRWMIFQLAAPGRNGSGQINSNGASQVAFGSFSDRRLKDNIVSLSGELSKILALNPVEFDYKEGGHQVGFIAQEIEEVYPDAVDYLGETEKMKSITGWDKTSARLVKAIQEQQAQIEALKAEVAALKAP